MIIYFFISFFFYKKRYLLKWKILYDRQFKSTDFGPKQYRQRTLIVFANKLNTIKQNEKENPKKKKNHICKVGQS